MRIRENFLLGLDVVFIEEGDIVEVIAGDEYVNRSRLKDLVGKSDFFVIKAENLEPPI